MRSLASLLNICCFLRGISWRRLPCLSLGTPCAAEAGNAARRRRQHTPTGGCATPEVFRAITSSPACIDNQEVSGQVCACCSTEFLRKPCFYLHLGCNRIVSSPRRSQNCALPLQNLLVLCFLTCFGSCPSADGIPAAHPKHRAKASTCYLQDVQLCR